MEDVSKLKEWADNWKEKGDRAILTEVFKNIYMEKDNNTKGDLGGICNRTACETNYRALYYNHSTQKYYCFVCAEMINEANKADAMRLFGHELCTLDKKAFNLLAADYPYKKEGSEFYAMLSTEQMEQLNEALGAVNEPPKKRLFSEYEKEMTISLTNPYIGIDHSFKKVEQYIRSEPKVNRNDPCTCGSGKKYKKCCGK